MIRTSILVVGLGLLASTTLFANNKEQRRLENSGVVMQEIMNVPDDLPRDVMERAKCVIVFPSVLKAAFVVGASYSRTRGVFIGVSLEGSTLRPDDDATFDVYGRKLTAREIVIEGRIGIPPSGRHLVGVLQRNSPYNESKESAGNK